MKKFIKDNYSNIEEDCQIKGKVCYCGRKPDNCRLYVKKTDGLILFDCKSASCEVGCGGVRASGNMFVQHFTRQTQQEADRVCPTTLPEGYTYGVPKKALTWLIENGIREEDIKPYKIGYDTDRQRIVIPVYMNGKLETWLGRDWAGTHPLKWLTPKGATGDAVFESIMPEERGEIAVIVEDAPSAIRVGRHYPTWAILGTNVNAKRLAKLLQRFRATGIKRVCVALDDDADKNALKIQKQLTDVGIMAYIKHKHLGKDPKYMTDRELQEVING